MAARSVAKQDFDSVASPMRDAIWQAQSLCEVLKTYVHAQSFGEREIGMNIKLTLDAVSRCLTKAADESNALADRYDLMPVKGGRHG